MGQRARVLKLEDALTRLEGTVQTQAQDVVALLQDKPVPTTVGTSGTPRQRPYTWLDAATKPVLFAPGQLREPKLAARNSTYVHFMPHDIPGRLLCKCLPIHRTVAAGRVDAILSMDEIRANELHAIECTKV